jgi:hypothetical protein
VRRGKTFFISVNEPTEPVVTRAVGKASAAVTALVMGDEGFRGVEDDSGPRDGRAPLHAEGDSVHRKWVEWGAASSILRFAFGGCLGDEHNERKGGAVPSRD